VSDDDYPPLRDQSFETLTSGFRTMPLGRLDTFQDRTSNINWKAGMLRRMIALTVLIGAGIAAAQDAKPPVAPVHNVLDEYHGVKVDDPYRYMEKLDDPQVAAWFKAQATYTEATLQAIPGRKALLARLQDINRSTPAVVQNVRRFPGNRVYYEKRGATESLFKLYVRNGFQGTERLLVDAAKFVTNASEHMSLDWWEPSRDGRFVAFGISGAGSEQAVLHIVDARSGKLLPDTIDRCRVGQVSWAEDDSFLYNRLQKIGANTPPTDYFKNSRLYRHVIGREAEQDPAVLGPGVPDGNAETLRWRPVALITPGSDYVLGVYIPGAEKRRAIYKQPIAALGTKDGWTKVVDLADEITGFAVHGDDLYLVSQHDAPHGRVLVTNLSDSELKQATVLVPQGSSVIEEIVAASDALYVRTADAGSGSVLRLKYGSTVARPVPQPVSTSAWHLEANSGVPGVIIGIDSWVRRVATYVYEPAAGAMVNPHLESDSPTGFGEFQVSELRVKSHDGTLVPLTVISKAGLARNGGNPTLLIGYGAYGISMDPGIISITYLQPWLERGGVWAVAHVRGGGEYGEEWHTAGKGLTKENTWKDFIACAQYLIEQKYTSPDRLGTWGASAGGITVGMALVDRPDLFAAVIEVAAGPDMIRFERTPNGPGNIIEFGTVKDRAGFDGLLKMSAYHHVKNGTRYPAVLIETGFNDPRALPWESAKMAARLQAATSSGKPVLLRVDYDAGHGVGSTERQFELQFADEYSFLLWQMGVPDFQPLTKSLTSPDIR
jgi:prolyl oligopeptidase